jgi:hypothetical protein
VANAGHAASAAFSLGLLLRPVELWRSIMRADAERRTRQRHADALRHLRLGFELSGRPLDEMTDAEVDALCAHAGVLAGRAIEAKTLAVEAVLMASDKATGGSDL